jgi:hypothetical protein
MFSFLKSATAPSVWTLCQAGQTAPFEHLCYIENSVPYQSFVVKSRPVIINRAYYLRSMILSNQIQSFLFFLSVIQEYEMPLFLLALRIFALRLSFGVYHRD